LRQPQETKSKQPTQDSNKQQYCSRTQLRENHKLRGHTTQKEANMQDIDSMAKQEGLAMTESGRRRN
jgi:hypothetical protein